MKVKLFVFVLIVFLIPIRAIGSAFEGSLQVLKATLYDTTYIIYHVKANKIRVEEFSNNAQLLNIFIIDVENELIYAIDIKNKFYKQIQNKSFVPVKNDNLEIIKTENFIYLNGYRCNQWRVRNKSRNSEIAFWVARDDFMFYEKMLKINGYMDKMPGYFLFIPGASGFMPMLAVERTILRDEKSRLEVIRIEKEIVNKNLFIIPPDYKRLD